MTEQRFEQLYLRCIRGELTPGLTSRPPGFG